MAVGEYPFLCAFLTHLTHLLLAVKRLSNTHKQTIKYERYGVRSGEFILLAAVRPLTTPSSAKAFNQFASTLTATYEALHFSLERYSLAVPVQS